MIGQRLSHFKITAKLGEGGMGAVYLAEDTKLGREVAIKVLPEAFVADPERLARFEREARVLATLNHPSIAAIHEVGEAEGTEGAPPEHYLVMELAEGEELTDRLARGPIPVEDALPIALQIAAALEAAHEAGVVHRDLKPANIKVTSEGDVKVLDFGLAKAWDTPGGSSPAISQSPTLTAGMTLEGVILGTAAYMSPEQAKGSPADKRADIWAFGVVLFEMLTGQRLFVGESVSDTLAAVLRDELSFTNLPSELPPRVEGLLSRCLDRDPRTRLRDIGEARVVLSAPGDATPETAVVDEERVTARPPIGWIVGTLALAAAVAALVWIGWGNPKAAPASSVEFRVAPPSQSMMRSLGSEAAPVAVSPDGSRLIFGLLEASGRNRLWVRSLTDVEPRPLAGTENGTRPFWSPDSQVIAFFADGELRRIDADGGPVTTICEAGPGRGGSWSADGTIVLAPEADSPISAVEASGGELRPVTEDLHIQGDSHRYPHFLPDGKRFLFLRLGQGGASGTQSESEQEVYVGYTDGSEPRLLLQGVSNAEYDAGHLFYMHDDSLIARRFDAARLELGDEVRVVAPNLNVDYSYEKAIFSTAGGTIALQTRPGGKGDEIVWIDRSGKHGERLGGSGTIANPIISPTGEMIAWVSNDAGANNIWLYDPRRDVRTRLSVEEGQHRVPRFSPDGSWIAYTVVGREGGNISKRRVGSSGDAEVIIIADQSELVPLDWSPDGRYLLVLLDGGDISLLDFESGELTALLDSEFGETYSRFSPDGRWLAYTSDESGRDEVYISPFPSLSDRQQVSRNGGREPLWNPAGGSIFFRDLFNSFIETQVDLTDGELQLGEDEVLFRALPLQSQTFGDTYAVTPDGQRFLVHLVDEEQALAPLTVLLNWRPGTP